MNKGAWLGGGLGLLTLLGGLYYTGLESKSQVQEVNPSMEATYKGANIANVVTLNAARNSYFLAKEKAPDKAEDLVPEFLTSIPAEAFSKSNAVVRQYDGTGGWVMADDGFKPNFPQTLETAAK